jgi:hypothetical protein
MTSPVTPSVQRPPKPRAASYTKAREGNQHPRPDSDILLEIAKPDAFAVQVAVEIAAMRSVIAQAPEVSVCKKGDVSTVELSGKNKEAVKAFCSQVIDTNVDDC